MAEEFQESDVVFPDYTQITTNINYVTNSKTPQTKKLNSSSSPPMKIPVAGIRFIDVVDYNHDDDDDDDDNDEESANLEVGCTGESRLPPHLIIARRIGGEMACSFYVEDGNGRILKGRNLCKVRNSILRLTGFYET